MPAGIIAQNKMHTLADIPRGGNINFGEKRKKTAIPGKWLSLFEPEGNDCLSRIVLGRAEKRR